MRGDRTHNRWLAGRSVTEQIVLGAVRVGQHLFARTGFAKCCKGCVLSGFHPARFGWQQTAAGRAHQARSNSGPSERLDARDDLAGLPGAQCSNSTPA